MTHTAHRAALIALAALAAGAFTLVPAMAQEDNPPDPAQQIHDYLHDPTKSTTPADIFLPGSTVPVRRDPGESAPPADPLPAPEQPAEPSGSGGSEDTGGSDDSGN